MGLFDGIKAMASVTKDIIATGKATFKACEAMDALIERAKNLGDISIESKNAIKAVEVLRESEDENKEEKLEEAQVKALEAFQKDSKLSAEFKDECREAVLNFKEVSNSIYDKVGNTLSKYAETEEELEAIQSTIAAEKKN